MHVHDMFDAFLLQSLVKINSQNISKFPYACSSLAFIQTVSVYTYLYPHTYTVHIGIFILFNDQFLFHYKLRNSNFYSLILMIFIG